MFLLREETKLSFPEIGQKLGGRDHSTVIHACDQRREKGDTMKSGTEPVPWNETIELISYNGDAVNLFPERMSFSCAMGHVREMRGSILTVRYKLHRDVMMISEPPHEDRFLVILAHIEASDQKKFAIIRSYKWIATEILRLPTEHHGTDGLPMMMGPIVEPIIRSTLSSFLIMKDGGLRPHSELIGKSRP